MKKFLMIMLAVSMLVIPVMAQQSKVKLITSMSYTFDEQRILVQVIKQLIEDSGIGTKVNIRDGSGGAMIAHAAMVANNIQIRPTYSGTEFTTIMQQTITKEFLDPKILGDWIRVEAMKKYNFVVSENIGFNNTYALAIKRSVAEKLNIKTVSDFVKYAPTMVVAVDSDFYGRDGVLSFASFRDTYGLKFKKAVSIQYGLMYRAIETGDVDAIIAYSTEGKVKSMDLKLLIDDKNVFPPYDGIYVMRKDMVDADPRILEIINKIAGKINNEEMQELNLKVGNGDDIVLTVKSYLKSKGLLK